MAGIEFDDINVGDEIPSQYFKPDQKAIWRYAAASGDLNPIHMDRGYGSKAGLDGSIAHGLSTLARAGKCVTDWSGNPDRLKKLRARFNAPVKPGDMVTYRGRVIDKRIEGGGQLVEIGIEAENQDGVKVLSRCMAVIEL
ncbi:MAG: MaoC family dehydratase N-terminal domain-containing protein [Actinobacteria bacterium]|nr:MaoC family dehydratase N-terminal domain-containing protein [Actinomycetota bacterium]